MAATHDNVLGVLSLIFWSLTLIISIKYILFVMRADNNGEGGILALLALVAQAPDAKRKSRAMLIALGLFGAALLYGDGMITPAISVLGAVEGLEIATHIFEPYIVPITLVILVSLFMIQSRGTTHVGMLFGPVMVVWFITIGFLGLTWIVREPRVLTAFNPIHGLSFFLANGWHGFVVLGAVFLVVTGGEASVRRHGALRAKADPPGLVFDRVASALPELPRTGRDDPARPGRGLLSVLLHGAAMGAAPAGRARHRWRPSLRRRR